MIHERLHVNEALYWNKVIPKQMTLFLLNRMNHESFSGRSKLAECVSGSVWRSSWRRRRVFASWWPTILTTRLSTRTRWSGKRRRWSSRGVRYDQPPKLSQTLLLFDMKHEYINHLWFAYRTTWIWARLASISPREWATRIYPGIMGYSWARWTKEVLRRAG